MPNSGTAPTHADTLSAAAAQSVMEAVANSTASMTVIKDQMKDIVQEVRELRRDQNEDSAVHREINQKLKLLVGNGDTDLEPIIPRLMRQQDEMLNFKSDVAVVLKEFPAVKTMAENHDRLQFRIGVIYAGGGSILGALAIAAWGWIKHHLGWS